MAERYSRLFTLPTNFYSEGSPVLIETGALLRDNVTGGVLAQLKFFSFSSKVIKAMTVGIIPCDIAGRRLSDAVMHQYLDMNFGRDSEFGQKNAIALPDPATRSFKVYVSEAVFGDNSIYSAPECEWTPLNVAQKPVGHTVLNSDPELFKQFRMMYDPQCTYNYVPKKERDLWFCSCQAINRSSEAVCHNCGQKYLPLESIDIKALKTARDKRVAEERRQAEEAAAEAERQRREALQRAAEENAKAEEYARLAAAKRKKILSITLPSIAVCIAFVTVLITVIIPKIKLNKAISMLDSGDYDSAYALLEEIDGKAAIYADKYDKAIEYINSSDYEAAYILLNGMVYKDSENKLQSIKANYPLIPLAIANVGDIVYFGTYEQDNDTSNGKEDIEWLILAKEDNKVLIISDKALDRKQYNTSQTNITWESCSLRKWLNDTFLNAAFSAEEQAFIQSTKVSNATTDKVFLLSIDEADKYFSSNEARKCIPTFYVEKNRYWMIYDDYTKDDKFCIWWWTRSPGKYQSYAVPITGDGGIYYDGYYVDFHAFVRPAMWISTED